MAETNYGHNQYEFFANYIKDLIDGYADNEYCKDKSNINKNLKIDAKNFSGAAMDGLADTHDIKNIWKDFLNFMSDEENQINHIAVRHGENYDLPQHYSGDSWKGLFEFISNNADLYDKKGNSVFSELKTSIKQHIDSQEQLGNDYWNDSVTNLIKEYLKNFDYSAIKSIESEYLTTDNDTKVDTTINGSIDIGDDKLKFRISDIVNANAGEYFLKNKRWTRPWVNIDKDTYKGVRKDDAMLSAITSDKNLQFTRKCLNSVDGDHYFRLIMPKYLRQVEVEDLNRNFWVIGQALSGICGFVFNDESPLVDIFDRLLKELAHLWNDTVLIWMNLGENYAKEYNDIKIIFMPIPNSEWYPFVKYDDFIDKTPELNIEELSNRYRFLSYQYKESNIIIVPELRGNNYFKNYYSKVTYPGIIFYNRNNNKWNWYPFKDNQDNYSIVIDLSTSSLAGGITKDSGQYKYLNIDSYGADQTDRYTYMMPLRIEYTYSENISDNILTIEINFILTDVAAELCGGTSSTQFNAIMEIDLETNEITSSTVGTISIPQASVSDGYYPIEKGYYLGEVLSSYFFSPPAQN